MGEFVKETIWLVSRLPLSMFPDMVLLSNVKGSLALFFLLQGLLMSALLVFSVPLTSDFVAFETIFLFLAFFI